MSELEYTCACCGETYLSDRSEAETRAEADALFDGFHPDAAGVLCDDCWQEFVEWMTAQYGPPPWPSVN